jgi:HEAT repeat protein
MLDHAFEALTKFDWGTDLAALAPIEDAVVAAHGKPDDRIQLEKRLIDALEAARSRDAGDYICRKLAIVGSAAAVPSLAARLGSPESSHMARYALERISAPEAAAALRQALPELRGNLRIGVIGSLGSRKDAAAIPALAGLLNDGDAATARAAALALGAIGAAEGAQALQAAAKKSGAPATALIDALLHCAESLLADEKLAEAGSIYQTLNDPRQPRLVRLAATRGLLACARGQA